MPTGPLTRRYCHGLAASGLINCVSNDVAIVAICPIAAFHLLALRLATRDSIECCIDSWRHSSWTTFKGPCGAWGRAG